MAFEFVRQTPYNNRPYLLSQDQLLSGEEHVLPGTGVFFREQARALSVRLNFVVLSELGLDLAARQKKPNSVGCDEIYKKGE